MQLADRMKFYENNSRFTPTLPIIARIDGRNFHKYTKDAAKPFDRQLQHLFKETTKTIMGCFDSNCCLSGLPIHQGDQIMTGLVGKTATTLDIGLYPCSLWSFFTPAVNAIYNSSIDNFKSDDATVLKLFLDLLRPKLEAKGGSKLSFISV